MNRKEIDTFLKAYEVGSIARSAQELFVEQGTASKRIAQLEAELGVRLFNRSRGVRRTTLTPEGEAFLPIAQRMAALYDEAHSVTSGAASTRLGLVATSSVLHYHLTPFLVGYVGSHHEVLLNVHVEHSREAHALIDTQRADVALVTSRHPVPSVVTKPLFAEPFAVLFHAASTYALTGNPVDLHGAHEVYLPYSTQYGIWHNSMFPEARDHHMVTVGSLCEAGVFLQAPDGWCIVTQAMAQEWVATNPGWRWSGASWLPEPRVVYLAHHKNPLPGKDEACESLVSELRAHLAAREACRVIG